MCSMKTAKQAAELIGLPQNWPSPPGWPFLLLVRPNGVDNDVGLIYDAFHKEGVTGFSATVWLCGLLQFPLAMEERLTIPHEVFDTPEDIAIAGWTPMGID